MNNDGTNQMKTTCRISALYFSKIRTLLGRGKNVFLNLALGFHRRLLRLQDLGHNLLLLNQKGADNPENASRELVHVRLMVSQNSLGQKTIIQENHLLVRQFVHLTKAIEHKHLTARKSQLTLTLSSVKLANKLDTYFSLTQLWQRQPPYAR